MYNVKVNETHHRFVELESVAVFINAQNAPGATVAVSTASGDYEPVAVAAPVTVEALTTALMATL